MKSAKEDQTFIVKILNTQNDTCHGTVAWTNGCRQECFHSALEQIGLIDSAMTSGREEEMEMNAL